MEGCTTFSKHGMETTAYVLHKSEVHRCRAKPVASVKESIPATLPSHTLYTAVVRDAAAKYKAVPNQTCDALLTKATD